MGLAAQTINLGVVEDVGVVAESDDLSQRLEASKDSQCLKTQLNLASGSILSSAGSLSEIRAPMPMQENPPTSSRPHSNRSTP